MEAGLRQFGCDDAPDEPDRKTEMLGENRPYEITSRDEFAFGFPKLLILWVPVRNPHRVALAHQVFLPVGPDSPAARAPTGVALARPVPTYPTEKSSISARRKGEDCTLLRRCGMSLCNAKFFDRVGSKYGRIRAVGRLEDPATGARRDRAAGAGARRRLPARD